MTRKLSVLVGSAVLALGLGCPMEDDDGLEPEDDDMEMGEGEQLYAIAGLVSRLESAAPAESGDAIGTLYIVALTACELTAPPAGFAVVPGADFSSVANEVAYEIPALADGTYHLALFLDDNEDADPAAAAPGPGDQVYATGNGPDGVLSCIEVVIDGGDQEASLALTATVPGG